MRPHDPARGGDVSQQPTGELHEPDDERESSRPRPARRVQERPAATPSTPPVSPHAPDQLTSRRARSTPFHPRTDQARNRSAIGTCSRSRRTHAPPPRHPPLRPRPPTPLQATLRMSPVTKPPCSRNPGALNSPTRSHCTIPFAPREAPIFRRVTPMSYAMAFSRGGVNPR